MRSRADCPCRPVALPVSAPPLGEAPSTQGLSPFSVLTSASDGAEVLFPSSNRRRDSNTSFINSRVHIHSAAPLTPRASPLSSFYRLRLQIASLTPRRPPTTSTTATTTCCFPHGASRLSTSYLHGTHRGVVRRVVHVYSPTTATTRSLPPPPWSPRRRFVAALFQSREDDNSHRFSSTRS